VFRTRLRIPYGTQRTVYFRGAALTVGFSSQHNAGAWQSKPEFPTPSEILPPLEGDHVGTLIHLENEVPSNDDLRPNRIEGAYENKEDYLQTHYDLLREDAVRPLRNAVIEVRKDPSRDEKDYPPSCNIGIYTPTYITSVVFSSRGLAVKVAFSMNRVKKYIHWKQSKRLITGTLVALSPAEDGFKSQCIIATVAARPLSALEAANPPNLDLFFARAQDFEIDPMRNWIMVECRSSFFEASRHTLLSLQHIMHEP
jgi:helicase required for RNAi-mediated heterochromatin assembly 1